MISVPLSTRPYTFRIYGNPIAKARPRFFRRGKFTGTYDSQKMEAGKWMLQLQEQASQQMDAPLTGPLMADFQFYFSRPKNHYGTGRNAGKLKDSAPKYCTNAKDFDNLAKFSADCMNSIVYKDDRQIVDAAIHKRYVDSFNDQPLTIIFLWEL